MDDDAGGHQSKIDDDGHPPENALPAAHLQIAQHPDPHQQTGDGTRQMRHIANLIVLVGQVTVHRGAQVGEAEYQEG